jgi:hypothetical protein
VRSNGEFVLQHPLHHSNNACPAHGPTAAAGWKPGRYIACMRRFWPASCAHGKRANFEVVSGR